MPQITQHQHANIGLPVQRSVRPISRQHRVIQASTLPMIGELSLSQTRVAAGFSRVAPAAQVQEWRREGLEIAELLLDVADVKDAEAVAELAAGYAELPLVMTARVMSEGGRFTGDEQQRQKLLCELPVGDAVDVELAADILPAVADAVKKQGRTLIVSRHNFEAADSSAMLDDKMAAALAAGADVFKCACLCTDAVALETLRAFAKRCRAAGKACVVIGMDDGSGSTYARRARQELPQAGSCIAFAAADQPSAPGQLSLAETVAACRDGAGADGAQ